MFVSSAGEPPVERESLESLLEQGLSIARIAKRFGMDPSTVSYWMAKYGLKSIFRDKHRAKGGIPRERLVELVNRGMTIAEIAAAVGLSKGTVQHWMRRYGLRTVSAASRRSAEVTQAARAAGKLAITMRCPRHGSTDFILEGRGYYRCKRCRADSVVRRRKRLKQILVEEAGGCCAVCGYNRSVRALQFHHLEPENKRLGLSGQGVTHSLATLRAEAKKCVLLCSNCHAEVEDGVTSLPLQFRRDTAGL